MCEERMANIPIIVTVQQMVVIYLQLKYNIFKGNFVRSTIITVTAIVITDS